MLWNGQNHRFYPQDIVDVLPKIFKMDEKEKEEFITSDDTKIKIKQMKDFKDSKFETFYCSLRQKRNFPKTYKVKGASLTLEKVPTYMDSSQT